MTKECLYEWFAKNGWIMAKKSPLGGYESWTPTDRHTVYIFVLESTVIVQGSEIIGVDEVLIENVEEEDGKLIIGAYTILGRLSKSPTYGKYVLSCTLKVTYTSKTAEEFEEAEENAENEFFHDFINHYSTLESTRITDAWRKVRFTPAAENESSEEEG